MLTPRSTLTRRLVAALDASPSRIPVLVGGCGSGRTTLIQLLRDRVGRGPTVSIDVERTATTPERFRALAAASPLPVGDSSPAGTAPPSTWPRILQPRARRPVTFLLDEFLSWTFKASRAASVLRDFIDCNWRAAQVRAHQPLRRPDAQTAAGAIRAFEVIDAGLTVEDTLELVSTAAASDTAMRNGGAERAILADGRPAAVRALADNWR
jgi:hypothetical protein